ncbi:uncharacterized protein MONBRDRAFT_16245 [Monosiga brevicollis MX1]|uniref:Exostosin GT47 domain-containing protein n=1 Tax=Monosiga brevicollis TaxID=81824 RepID=A9UVQ4_MONBE|nr:uncharacterized protein MONBRDRAFT_16245 [Monosiga brevicollis MX1]EDQ90626.1 predicted protein [Monosiga brevicollis MX1]|eukprot:XP_001744677.1 hypothetical protein [Monosiga brevicollis MX1]
MPAALQDQAHRLPLATRGQVWSKAAVGDYFIEHIMGTKPEPRLSGVWYFARTFCGPLRFTYRAGHGVAPHKVPNDPRHVVLILNGHDDEHAATARPWLDLLPSLPQLRSVGLIVLGYEDCSNTWLAPYLRDPCYKISFTFMVYGGQWPGAKDMMQWPLGVATYRGFPAELPYHQARGPRADSAHLGRRPWLCSLQATIYPNSSRSDLLRIIDQQGLREHCFVEARMTWQPNESSESRQQYTQALLTSDYTLAPAGLNTECYRWYEAAAAGSIPIVEDVTQPPTCGRDPLALMKEHGAPFIYIKTWSELPELLARLQQRPPAELVAHRRRLVEWYEGFRLAMRYRFCSAAVRAFGASGND